MTSRYSIDIYRTDDAILIHERPGGWKRALPALLLSLLPVFFLIVVAALCCFDPPRPVPAQPVERPDFPFWSAILVACVLGPTFGFVLYSFVYIFLCSLWRIGGHETLLIDRDSVRRDWWCFWGRRSRIYPRPQTIQMKKCPGSWLLGGPTGGEMRICKDWRKFRWFSFYLPNSAERFRLFEELDRFQREVPTTPSTDENGPARKGSFGDPESGPNLLYSFDFRGAVFRRIVPKSESVTEKSSNRTESGVLVLRCAKCHEIVSRDHVLPARPLAECPGCGFVFEPGELVRTLSLKESRIRIRRDADSLGITQQSFRNGLPLWTVLLFVLFDLGVVAFYLFMKQNFPDENIMELLRSVHDPDIRIAPRMLFALAVIHLLALPIPTWSLFDRRTIRLDRENLEIAGCWLVFPWKKIVSRFQVRKASYNVVEDLFHNLRIGYENGFVLLGCTNREEVESLRNEINHFLYTVEPVRRERVFNGDSEPVFLAGADTFDPEVELYCPGCGAKLLRESLDFPNDAARCHACENEFSLENANGCRIDVAESRQPENITVEQTEARLTMRYVPHCEKGVELLNRCGFYFCIFMFGGMFSSLIFMLIREGRFQSPPQILFWTIYLAPLALGIVFVYFMLCQELNAFYCDWMIQVDGKEARLELRCKNRCKTIAIPRERIVEARPNSPELENLFKMVRFGPFPDFLWSRKIFGAHFFLDDGSVHYLPLGSLDTRNAGEVRSWMLAKLNGFLASHPTRKHDHGKEPEVQRSGTSE